MIYVKAAFGATFGAVLGTMLWILPVSIVVQWIQGPPSAQDFNIILGVTYSIAWIIMFFGGLHEMREEEGGGEK